ncbi:OB-fold-like protein [Raphanus sativus]|nr:OB-fold-like protein [Raphanus sativus]
MLERLIQEEMLKSSLQQTESRVLTLHLFGYQQTMHGSFPEQLSLCRGTRLSSFVKDVASVVTIGQEVKVKLVEADIEAKPISLTMRTKLMNRYKTSEEIISSETPKVEEEEMGETKAEEVTEEQTETLAEVEETPHLPPVAETNKEEVAADNSIPASDEVSSSEAVASEVAEKEDGFFPSVPIYRFSRYATLEDFESGMKSYQNALRVDTKDAITHGMGLE